MPGSDVVVRNADVDIPRWLRRVGRGVSAPVAAIGSSLYRELRASGFFESGRSRVS